MAHHDRGNPMTARRSPRIGDRFVTQCTTTDWRMAADVKVVAEKITRLGCGCTRVECARPGPEDGPLAGQMEMLVDRCLFHGRNHSGWGDEPVRLEAPDEAELRAKLERLGIAP